MKSVMKTAIENDWTGFDKNIFHPVYCDKQGRITRKEDGGMRKPVWYCFCAPQTTPQAVHGCHHNRAESYSAYNGIATPFHSFPP